MPENIPPNWRKLLVAERAAAKQRFANKVYEMRLGFEEERRAARHVIGKLAHAEQRIRELTAALADARRIQPRGAATPVKRPRARPRKHAPLAAE